MCQMCIYKLINLYIQSDAVLNHQLSIKSTILLFNTTFSGINNDNKIV